LREKGVQEPPASGSAVKVMEQTVAYLSIIGALMVSNQFHWGWVAYLIASTTGMVWSYKKKYQHLLVMNIFFTIANFCGIWNYLIQTT
jgi:hypothetical protein